jgi:YVTN family beta-propeller protein
VSPEPSPTDRRQRQLAQSNADRLKHQQSVERSQQRAERRRWVLRASVVGAVLVAVLATVLWPSNPPPRSRPRLLLHTVLRLPAGSALARGIGGAWVTDDLRDRLIRFDPSDGRTEQFVHLSGRPVAMLLAGADLWVADMVSNSVEEVVARSLRVVRTVPVPTGPSGLAELDGQIWVTSVIANEVTPLNPLTGKTGASLHVPAGAVRIAAGFGALWVTGTTDELTEIDLTAHGIGPVLPPFEVGNAPIGVATGDGSVWVANTLSGTVVRIDPRTRKVIHTYHVGGDPLALTVAGGRVWLADGTAQTLRTLFPTGGPKPVGLGATPRFLLPLGNAVWVAANNPGRVIEASVR